MNAFLEFVKRQRWCHGGRTKDGKGSQTPEEDQSLHMFVHDPCCDTMREVCCPICFIEWKYGALCCKTNCGHVFHTSCLHGWLSKKKTCPICRSIQRSK